jgi:hypothetical protein
LDIPPDVKIRASIRTGSVYYFPYEMLHSSQAHYFVVLNIDPISEKVIILLCASSQIEKVKLRNKYNPPETIVQISREQYPDFTTDITVFDCNNSVFLQNINALVERLSQNKLQLKKEMDHTLVEKLRQGVISSRQIPVNIKRQLGMSSKH